MSDATMMKNKYDPGEGDEDILPPAWSPY